MNSTYILLLSATTGAATAATVVTNDMTDLADFSGNTNWSTASGVAQTAATNDYLTMAQGVPAPVEIGDSVTASVVKRITVGSTIPVAANRYALRLAITANNDGTGGLAKSMWTRRQPNTGTIWGHALTSPGNSWDFAGWKNTSTIGLASPTDSTSDWFTSELTITKQASGYDLSISYYDSSNTLLSSATSTGVALAAGLASSSTWYANFGTEYQSIEADIASVEVDSVTLTSSVDAIPEPSSALLVGLASLGLIRRRR